MSELASSAMSLAINWLADRSEFWMVFCSLEEELRTYTDTVAVYWFCIKPQLTPAVASAKTTGRMITIAKCFCSNLNSSSNVIRPSFCSGAQANPHYALTMRTLL